MDASGKIIWARHNEVQTVNIKVRAWLLGCWGGGWGGHQGAAQQGAPW